MMDLFIAASCGATVYFARPDALKGSLIDTLKEVSQGLLNDYYLILFDYYYD